MTFIDIPIRYHIDNHCSTCFRFQTNPPIHRVLGFIIIFATLIVDIPFCVMSKNSLVFMSFIICSIYFGIFLMYIYRLLFIKHYSDNQNNNISLLYIKTVKDHFNVFMRYILLFLYIVIFIGLWGLPTFVKDMYMDMNIFEKTMFTWNYIISSLGIIYIYEHICMFKYLTKDNIVLCDSENLSIGIQDEYPLEDI